MKLSAPGLISSEVLKNARRPESTKRSLGFRGGGKKKKTPCQRAKEKKIAFSPQTLRKGRKSGTKCDGGQVVALVAAVDSCEHVLIDHLHTFHAKRHPLYANKSN